MKQKLLNQKMMFTVCFLATLYGVWTPQSKKLVYYDSYAFKSLQKFTKFEAGIFGLIFQSFLRAFESQNHLNKSCDIQALNITPASSSWAVN